MTENTRPLIRRVIDNAVISRIGDIRQRDVSGCRCVRVLLPFATNAGKQAMYHSSPLHGQLAGLRPDGRTRSGILACFGAPFFAAGATSTGDAWQPPEGTQGNMLVVNTGSTGGRFAWETAAHPARPADSTRSHRVEPATWYNENLEKAAPSLPRRSH